MTCWLIVAEYLCYKEPQICSTRHNHNPVLCSFMTYHRVCNKIKSNARDATCGAGTAYPSGTADQFILFLCGIHVARSLVFCVLFCRSLFVLLSFYIGHFIVCPSIYGFWLPLWYLQTFLIRINRFHFLAKSQ